jgi:CDP-4-dehydro-6-deoxyglucose reductase
MTTGSPPAAPQRATLSARIERIFDHAPDTRSLFLSLTSGRHLRFVPGQFISITIPLGDETRLRPYSIASDPEDRGPFEICFNRVAGGRGVAWLFERRVGDVLDFTGPFGAFTIDQPPDAELGFVAEGTGVAPIRPMLKRSLPLRGATSI